MAAADLHDKAHIAIVDRKGFDKPGFGNDVPLIGSNDGFQDGQDCLSGSLTLGLTFDCTGHDMFKVQPVNRQNHFGLKAAARWCRRLAQGFFDRLLRGDADLLEKLAHRHVKIVAHWDVSILLDRFADCNLVCAVQNGIG